MMAAKGGHVETVETLIAAGADLNLQCDKVYINSIILLYVHINCQNVDFVSLHIFF